MKQKRKRGKTMSRNRCVYVLLDNEEINIFGIYTSSQNMIYAYNNLKQKEKNKLIEYRVISLNVNKNEKEIKGVRSQENYLIEGGILNGEKIFPYELD